MILDKSYKPDKFKRYNRKYENGETKAAYGLAKMVDGEYRFLGESGFSMYWDAEDHCCIWRNPPHHYKKDGSFILNFNSPKCPFVLGEHRSKGNYFVSKR